MAKVIFHCDDPEDITEDAEVWYECEACGKTLTIEFPTTALEWLRRSKEFTQEHRECRTRHRR